MSANLPSWYTQQFATTVQLLLQQKDSRLRSAVTTHTGYKGEQASPVDQVGAIEMIEMGAKFSPMGRVDAPLDRRWVFPQGFELPQLVDSFDELKMIIDPKSPLTLNAVAGAMRRQDRLIMNAFYADAKTGKNGGTTVSFPGSQVVAVNHGASSNVGMSVAKLREAKKKLLAAEVDVVNDPLYCAITAEEHDDLLAEAQVISLDYNDRPVLVEGMIQRFLGINFIHTELVPVDGSGYRRNPVWAKSGMHLGVWQEMKTSTSQRHDLTNEPWQLYLSMLMDATRLEEKKIVEIKSA